MSKRELKERKRREKAERKKNAAQVSSFSFSTKLVSLACALQHSSLLFQTPTFQTGGWYDDHEAFAEYDVSLFHMCLVNCCFCRMRIA